MRILVVEDEPKVAALLDKGLRAEGYLVTVAGDGMEGVRLALEEDFDLVVLDLLLPGKDGRTVLRELRYHKSTLPVIVLTVKDDLGSKVGSFDEGADDYLTKPFAFEELTARIRAHLRAREEPQATILRVGSLGLDLKTREAVRDGQRLPLTATEFRLLEFFMRHPRQVLGRAQLLNHVWSYDYEPGGNIVDVYVRYLRRKLNLDRGTPRIETVRGSGYRLAAD